MAFSPFQENTYVLYEQNEALIIDPGCFDEAEQQALKAFIQQEALVPKRLINTHCHIDHIYGNGFVKNTYNLPLEIPPEEQQVLDTADTLAMAFGAPPPQSPGADAYIREGDEVRVGNRPYPYWQPLVIRPDQGGIGRTDLPGADHQTLISTIRDKLLPLGDEVIVYPGHGPATTIGDERRHNPFLKA